MSVRAAIYVRISRDTEQRGLGVERQRKDCTALAKKKGWRVEQVYVDNDVSASKKKARPEYQGMMRAIEAGEINAVVVWDVDRLTRKPRELEDLIDFADKYGLQLASVGGEIDLATVQGRGMARMKGVFARMEAETTSRRMKAKHEESAAEGSHVGPRPFGWDESYADGTRKLVINDDEASVIQECADRILRGESLWRVANDLNQRGVTTSKGNPWATQTLRRVLLNWRNVGVRVHQPRDIDGRPVGKETRHQGSWDPVLDDDTFERLQAHLTDPSRRSNNESTTSKYLLTGIAECGKCGKALVAAKEFTYEIKAPTKADPNRRRVRTYPASYRCPHAGCHGVTRRMEPIDEMVARTVVAYLTDQQVVIPSGDPRQADAARKRVEVLQSKLLLLSDQWTDDLITQEQFDRQNARLRQQLGDAKQHLKSLAPEATPDGELLSEMMVPGAEAAWQKAVIERKRAVLRALKNMVGLRIVIEPVGSGASSGNNDPYQGISVTAGKA